MTRHLTGGALRFYMTGVAPCPYLPDRTERKVFVNLPFRDGDRVNDTLTQSGFRRSQTIAYRPACEACDACVSIRLPVAELRPSRTQARILRRNADLRSRIVPAEATAEQFDLLTRYLNARHPGGGMTGMGWADYVSMVEDTAVTTRIVEYRTDASALVAIVLIDGLGDGLSMVYSAYHPDLAHRSLGTYAILDRARQTAAMGRRYLYLGYWVRGSAKMDYKAGFRPMEMLTPRGWTRID